MKKDNQINFNDYNKISDWEINIIKASLLFIINFDNLNDEDLKNIKNLSHNAIFNKYIFYDPDNFLYTGDISDSSVRKGFITSLYEMMMKIKSDVQPDFNSKIRRMQNFIEEHREMKEFLHIFIEEISNNYYTILRNFFFGGSEMNYIENFMSETKSRVKKEDIISFLNSDNRQEAFILTSVYNLINKTFFLRMLEDIATDKTKFIEGASNFRYLSNGILNEKLKESKESLIEYVKSVYEFKKSDLKPYFFLLKKDIYSWVLDYISTYNLLEFIRLFNDINFKQLNQDILGDIYEHYLEQEKVTDKKSYRKLLGQYYTPKPIVRLMWLLVRNVLKEEKKRDLYEYGKPCLDILDPAYGSGTFLVEAILQSNQSALKKTINEKGKIFGFIKDRRDDKKIEEHLYGFELNPLSKSIADINLFFGLTETYGADSLKPFSIKTLKLYRTDSYDLDYEDINEDKKSEQMTVMHLFSEEIKNTIKEHSEIIKSKQQKYDIIIANPPYGHTKPNKFMKEQLIPFAYAEYNFNQKGEEISFNWKARLRKGKVPEFEKNRGKLYDNYGFFFGVADKLLNENSIICFITSNTYLSLPTYKWIRKYWLDNYTIHNIINFNKIGELNNSVFSPEADISTAIIVLEKKKNIKKEPIRFLSLENLSLIEKYNYICKSIKWLKPAKNKTHIKNFTIKNVNKFPFKELLIEDIRNDLDYVF